MPFRHPLAPLLFLLCGAVLAGSLFVHPAEGGTAANPAAENDRPPDFTLPDLDGNPVALRPLLGKKPILLVFWATWCPVCKEAIPEINSIHAGPIGGRLEIFGIDYRESREKVAAAVKSRDIRYPVLLDEHGEVARSYGLVGIPTYVLIDRNGKIVFRGNELPGDPTRIPGI